MNMNIVIGHTKTVFGACQQTAGQVLGNQTLAEAGQRHYFAGKGQVAIGEAQQIIKSCIDRLQIHKLIAELEK
ncbi:CsbD family protein [Oxalobacteraceae bacterium CAVE-383]|nr:CsbD family protein [Oxalobacteraceae bacterium CAVE-383]